MSENVMLMKLGARAQKFMERALPELMRSGLIEEVENRGAGAQRRFRLGVPLQRFNATVAAARGSFSRLLATLS